jgi:hypothetical protein
MRRLRAPHFFAPAIIGHGGAIEQIASSKQT